MVTEERLIYDAAFRRMEEQIKRYYPHGHFIAIAEERIVSDSNDFKALQKALKADVIRDRL